MIHTLTTSNATPGFSKWSVITRTRIQFIKKKERNNPAVIQRERERERERESFLTLSVCKQRPESIINLCDFCCYCVHVIKYIDRTLCCALHRTGRKLWWALTDWMEIRTMASHREKEREWERVREREWERTEAYTQSLSLTILFLWQRLIWHGTLFFLKLNSEQNSVLFAIRTSSSHSLISLSPNPPPIDPPL